MSHQIDTQDSQAVYAAVLADLDGSRAVLRQTVEPGLELDAGKERVLNDEQRQETIQDQQHTAPTYETAADTLNVNGDKPTEPLPSNAQSRVAESPRHISDANNDRIDGDDKSHTRLGRMEEVPAPQSQTQVNDDRDYDDLIGRLPSTYSQDHPFPDLGVINNNSGKEAFAEAESKTLDPDDTGAVNFGNLSPSSQVSEDVGFQNTRGAWRHDATSQPQPPQQQQQRPRQSSSHSFTPFKSNAGVAAAPETPAVNKNPFGARTAVGAPLGASQMFGQTQFSSAVKKPSPTSSRPSPHMLDMISPNIQAVSSPLKNRVNVSSPTTVHASSPSRLRDPTDQVARDNELGTISEETPSAEPPQVARSSPVLERTVSMSRQQPRGSYEPMRNSQQRKGSMELPVLESLVDDGDSDEEFRKRNEQRARIARLRASVAEEMDSVMLPLTKRTTGRGQKDVSRRKRRRLSPSSEDPLQRDVTLVAGDTSTQPVEVQASQQVAATRERITSSSPVRRKGPKRRSLLLGPNSSGPQGDQALEAIVPETPAGSLAVDSRTVPSASALDLPALDERDDEVSSAAQTFPSSAPPTKRRARQGYHMRQARRAAVATSSMTDPPATAPEQSSRGEAGTQPQRRTRGDKKSPQSSAGDDAPTAAVPETPAAPRTRAHDATSSPELTPAPSPTPQLTTETTPTTSETPVSAKSHSVADLSPGHRVGLRRSRRAATLSEGFSSGAKVKRNPRRHGEEDYLGADIPPHKSMMAPYASNRGTRNTTIIPLSQQGGLFQNMVFGISLGENNASKRSHLETSITDAGGIILEEGLQDLFEVPEFLTLSKPTKHTDEQGLSLKAQHQTRGFTAIIAVGPSSTPKYLQALALGLPCLAYQWVFVCLAKKTIVDWEPYLLSAGPSQYLGGAMRSRCLAPYDATAAQLADVLQQRRLLLQDQSLLVVMGGGSGPPRRSSSTGTVNKRKQLLFLAHALGPRTTRVASAELARAALREREGRGDGFDWVFVDENTCSSDDVLRLPPSGEDGGAKATNGSNRKKGGGGGGGRKSTTAGKKKKGQWAPWSWTVREMKHEFLVQSLILGGVLDEEQLRMVKGL